MIFQNSEQAGRARRPLIIFLHGFGRRRTAELDSFRRTFEADYDILMPLLFDPDDPKDCNGILWANRALNFVEKEFLKQRRIILGGFSMGGVIASWIATMLPVEKLILVAPAYDLINLKNTGNILSTLISHFTRIDSDNEVKNFGELPNSFYQTLIDVVLQFRGSVSRLNCPVLLVHGSQDSIVSPLSSRTAFAKMPSNQKQMFTLENGHHVLFEDEGVCLELLALIRLFLSDQIVIRPESKTSDDSVQNKSPY